MLHNIYTFYWTSLDVLSCYSIIYQAPTQSRQYILYFNSYLIFEIFHVRVVQIKIKRNGLTAGGGLRASNKFKTSDSIDNSLQDAEVVRSYFKWQGFGEEN